MLISRMRNFWILPVTVIGKASTKRKKRGTLKWAMRSLAQARSSSSVALWPGWNLIQATSSSPYLLQGMPITCTSATAGWVKKNSSSSRG
ncbi:hypothetical protein D9M68_969400 [compost metagenome]